MTVRQMTIWTAPQANMFFGRQNHQSTVVISQQAGSLQVKDTYSARFVGSGG